ncbi:MAG TPA: M28 family peptidase, partial [Caldithrix sp.]|nr:M28 family peptidase [Caldithrix sp.]
MLIKISGILNRSNAAIIIGLFCYVTAFAQNPDSAFSEQIIHNIKNHITYLGSDALEGRATGSNGSRLASDYIAGNLKKWAIKPIGTDSSYFQNIPMHGSMPLNDSQLLLQAQHNVINLKLYEDYLLFKCGAQTYIPNPAPLVFVGFGIIAPEYDYNDYLNIDVSGKIVVFLSGEPEFDDPEYFEGDNPTIYSYPESKQRIAIAQGAIGSIMIGHPTDPKFSNWDRLKNEFSFEDITLAFQVTSHLSLLLNPMQISNIFKGSHITFEESLEQINTHQFKSFMLNTKISFKGHFKEREFIGRNVIGLIEGYDPDMQDTYLILSAHYDHLGIGVPVFNDSIYNGVVDNALGVSGLLEIARLLKNAELPPRRSILLILVTGEEKGLLGSQYYVENPIVPLYKSIANVNIDGLAIFDIFNDVVGIGAEFSTLSDILEAIARVNGLRLSQIPPQFMGFESFSHSDQIAFAQGGIPAILISDGLNYKSLTSVEALQKWINWADQVYHTPFDDIYQPLNYKAIAQHVHFLYDFCHRLSRMEQQPQWKPGVSFRNV